jgi:hypothetical protein
LSAEERETAEAELSELALAKLRLSMDRLSELTCWSAARRVPRTA